MSDRKKRKAVDIATKLKILRRIEDGGSLRRVGDEFGIHHTTVKLIASKSSQLKEQQVLNADLSKKTLPKSTELREVNHLVMEFFKRCRQKNIPVSGPLLQEKAKLLADSFGVREFNASAGWLEKLKKRNEVQFRTLAGESADANLDVAEKWKRELPEILTGYHAEDIYNCDETALYYRQLPTKSLVLKGDNAKGSKLSKERLTVMLACNAAGDKLEPLIIGNAARPRAFHRNNVNTNNLPVTWRHNKSAWMTSALFTEYMTKIDQQMKRKKRHIIMLLDNAGCHAKLELQNVKLLFLPPNLTSQVQPLDQGIIRAMKAIYRKCFLAFLCAKADEVGTAVEFAKSVNVLDAIYWLDSAWKQVSTSTIQKCFVRCGVDAVEKDMMLGAPELAADLADIDVYESVPDAWLNELVEPHECIGMDDNVACTDDAGDSVEEIFEVVLTSHVSEADDDDDTEVVEDVGGGDKGELPVIVPSYSEVCSAISVLERYTLGNGCDGLDLVKSLQMVMSKHHCDEKRAKTAAKKQSTLLHYFK